MMVRSRWRTGLVGVVLAVGMTGGLEPARSQSAPAPQQPASGSSTVGSSTVVEQPQPDLRVSPAKLELLDPGTGDRQPLRLRLRAGDRQQVTLSMKANMQIGLGGSPTPINSSTEVRATSDVAIDRADANGNVAYTLRYSKVDIIPPPGTPPAAQQAINAAASQMQGISLRVTGNNRGQLSEVNVSANRPLEPGLQAMFSQLSESVRNSSIEFPVDPVGVGARWKVTMQVESNGLRIDQQATYEITELSPDRVVFAVTAEQTAPTQKIVVPGLTPDQSPSLRSYRATGSGRVAMQLNRPVPTQSNLEMKLRSEIDSPLGDGAMTISGDMTLTLDSPTP